MQETRTEIEKREFLRICEKIVWTAQLREWEKEWEKDKKCMEERKMKEKELKEKEMNEKEKEKELKENQNKSL